MTYVKQGWPIMIQKSSHTIKSRADWVNYKMPNPRAPHRMRMIREAVKVKIDAELAILGIMLGPLTMMYWYLMDATTLSMTLTTTRLGPRDVSGHVDWAKQGSDSR